jgi:hypothetical protein
VVEAHELEQRHVERRIVAPDLPPLGRLQERLVGQLAGAPIVEDRLQATRKRFEPDDEVCAAAIERRHGVQLPQMVIDIGMGFA